MASFQVSWGFRVKGSRVTGLEFRMSRSSRPRYPASHHWALDPNKLTPHGHKVCRGWECVTIPQTASPT